MGMEKNILEIFEKPCHQTVCGTSTFSTVADYVALLKLRVVSLVVFTGGVGFFLAPSHPHPLIAFTALLCLASGAGAAGALNMWLDRDIDAQMTRTQQRPLPRGDIHPGEALGFGLFLSCASILVMGLVVNFLAAFLLLGATFFYVGVYTFWLKKRTPQNIVIGGAAGALPPVIGWVAATNHMAIEAWILFFIIFFWTPPHFWSLSLLRYKEYAKASIPMLPVVAGISATKRQIFFYAALLFGVSLLPYALGFLGKIYAGVAFCLNGYFLFFCGQLWKDHQLKYALKTFGISIFYLLGLFLGMVVDRLWGPPLPFL